MEGRSPLCGVKNLRDARDGRQIQCDAVLQSCLGVPSFNFTQLEELLQPHVLVPEPVSLDRQLSASDADTEPQFVDVPVDIPIRRPLHAPRADDDHRGRDWELVTGARGVDSAAAASSGGGARPGSGPAFKRALTGPAKPLRAAARDTSGKLDDCFVV